VTQNIPTDRMTDPTPVTRLRSTTRTPAEVGAVPLGRDFTEHLQEAGYPDFEQAGLDFAAGQRLQARQTDNRNAATTGPAHPGEIVAGSASQDRWSGLAQPDDES
jgi:hypothetical protein